MVSVWILVFAAFVAFLFGFFVAAALALTEERDA